ncbi:MAG: protein kinase [Elusimicrobia bacterium]|nr:protein kinase [Elusimicrobiota bacterium]
MSPAHSGTALLCAVILAVGVEARADNCVGGHDGEGRQCSSSGQYAKSGTNRDLSVTGQVGFHHEASDKKTGETGWMDRSQKGPFGVPGTVPRSAPLSDSYALNRAEHFMVTTGSDPNWMNKIALRPGEKRGDAIWRLIQADNPSLSQSQLMQIGDRIFPQIASGARNTGNFNSGTPPGGNLVPLAGETGNRMGSLVTDPTVPTLPNTKDLAQYSQVRDVVAQVMPASKLLPEMNGDIAYTQGNAAGAVKDYTEALARGAPIQFRYRRGLAADQAGDHELANSDAKAVLRQVPGDRAAYALYMLTRARPSTVHLLSPAQLQGDDGRLAAAGVPGGAQWDGRQAGAAPSPLGASAAAPPTAAEVAAQENAAALAESGSQESVNLTRDAEGALRVRDPNTAERLAGQALAADPNNVKARFVRANAYLQSGQDGKAVDDLSAALALSPDNAPLHYTRAIAYGRQKLWDNALKDAAASVALAPTKGYSYQARAGVEWGLGQRKAMIDDLRQAASIDPKYQAALERAMSAPADVDPTLLFGDAQPAAAPAGQAPPQSPWRYLLWGLGGALAALGLLPILSSSVRRRVTTVLRRGPAQPAAFSDAPAPTGPDGLPASGFWRRYDVVREIGAGGMGVVYEAWDRSLERRVAVKRMRDEIRNDRRERERFLQEARTVAKLRHPNLVEIYSIEEDGPDAYLVFEFIDGQTLHEILQEKGSLTPAQARELFRGVCSGVDYAHRSGIVHRDLKPSNIIIEPDGRVKVMDFGVARQAADAMQRQALTNTVIGTPQYMAPEQENGVVCAQSDVYALGVCLYEALTGHPPFNGSPGAVTLAKLQANYEPLTRRAAGFPPALERVIERALDPKPETRIQSAAEFQQELEGALAGAPAA